MKEYSTIRVKKETKKRLSKHGGFKESYDDLINRLLDKVEESELQG